MHDINMFGLTYMQQIAEASDGTGLHIEPGIWAHVPRTSNPHEPPTVVRMASIPHGTVILTQGRNCRQRRTPDRRQQHPPVRHRGDASTQLRVRPDRADVSGARPVAEHAVSGQVARGDPEHGQEPEQRDSARDPGPEHHAHGRPASQHQAHAGQGRRHREHGLSGGGGEPPGWQCQRRRGGGDLLDRDGRGNRGGIRIRCNCSTRSWCS